MKKRSENIHADFLRHKKIWRKGYEGSKTDQFLNLKKRKKCTFFLLIEVKMLLENISKCITSEK